MNTVSIIVPVYDVEAYLDRCIASLLKQTLDGVEIILINDASPDNSEEIMKKYEERYPEQVKCIYLKENLCQGGARNIGVREANGEYITFVDADDYITPDMCEKLYRKAKDDGSDVVYCGYYVENQKGEKKAKYRHYFTDKMEGEFGKAEEILFENLAWAKLLRRTMFLKYDMKFPEHMKYEDVATAPLFTLYAYSISNIMEPLYVCCVRENSTVHKRNSMEHFDRIKAMDILWERTKQFRENEVYQIVIEALWVKDYLYTMKRMVNLFDSPDFHMMYEFSRKVNERYPDCEENPYFYYINQPYEISIYRAALQSEDNLRHAVKTRELSDKKVDYLDYYESCFDIIKELLESRKLRQSTLAIWGAGKRGEDFIAVCDTEKKYIDWVIDSNTQKIGTNMKSGHPIKGFAEIAEKTDCILVMNRLHYGDIMKKVNTDAIEVINLEFYVMQERKRKYLSDGKAGK